mmetsp:Transcript_25280/g.50838  ORF Transcript_25280/g.50838 Transcript_25280/m.50838 type:complete len:352 (-) Transcript_25280:225-1280(-)
MTDKDEAEEGGDQAGHARVEGGDVGDDFKGASDLEYAEELRELEHAQQSVDARESALIALVVCVCVGLNHKSDKGEGEGRDGIDEEPRLEVALSDQTRVPDKHATADVTRAEVDEYIDDEDCIRRDVENVPNVDNLGVEQTEFDVEGHLNGDRCSREDHDGGDEHVPHCARQTLRMEDGQRGPCIAEHLPKPSHLCRRLQLSTHLADRRPNVHRNVRRPPTPHPHPIPPWRRGFRVDAHGRLTQQAVGFLQGPCRARLFSASSPLLGANLLEQVTNIVSVLPRVDGCDGHRTTRASTGIFWCKAQSGRLPSVQGTHTNGAKALLSASKGDCLGTASMPHRCTRFHRGSCNQ